MIFDIRKNKQLYKNLQEAKLKEERIFTVEKTLHNLEKISPEFLDISSWEKLREENDKMKNCLKLINSSMIKFLKLMKKNMEFDSQLLDFNEDLINFPDLIEELEEVFKENMDRFSQFLEYFLKENKSKIISKKTENFSFENFESVETMIKYKEIIQKQNSLINSVIFLEGEESKSNYDKIIGEKNFSNEINNFQNFIEIQRDFLLNHQKQAFFME